MPLPLLSQFMPLQYQAILNGTLHVTQQSAPAALLQHHIGLVLQMYASACGLVGDCRVNAQRAEAA